ncbi:hypothetical protein EJP77_18940 [Paenibacillus zeisoli]|uniref:Uncharacterized protein n=1 Tax=Paenibacillus zeisoli TaxID=2496267 RepID=A0A433X1Y3_9BACL|nr:hypothetical protein [Paenibacillus zeisoli]RUT27912.1 hypothetical protein EJP77_18940 [Paenibacillus zeisoli]
MAVPNISTDELSLIKSWLMLVFIRKVFERDSRILMSSGVLKSPDVYVDMIASGADRVAVVMKEIQNDFTKSKIKIYEVNQSQQGIEAKYLCRGSRGEMRILWSALRSEMPSRMRAYLGVQPSTLNEQLSPI